MAEWPPDTGPEQPLPSHKDPDNFESGANQSETSERTWLERQIAQVGWETVFELLPPGVQEAYGQLHDDLSNLMGQLEVAENDAEASEALETSLPLYVQVLWDIESFRRVHGIWWGLTEEPRRAELQEAVDELLASDPFTANQRERLLEQYEGVAREEGQTYLDRLASDDLWELSNDSLKQSASSGLVALDTWRQLSTDGRHDMTNSQKILLNRLVNARTPPS